MNNILPISAFFIVFWLMVFGLLIPQTVFSQKEKLGVVQYTPPKGWAKTPSDLANSTKPRARFALSRFTAQRPAREMRKAILPKSGIIWLSAISKPKRIHKPKRKRQTAGR
ncbi:hypothetical protein BH18ACI1_BH18ACI1_16830 [soil metagenome]